MTVGDFRKIFKNADDSTIVKLVDWTEGPGPSPDIGGPESYKKEYDIKNTDIQAWGKPNEKGIKWLNIIIPYPNEKARTIDGMSYTGRQLLGLNKD